MNPPRKEVSPERQGLYYIGGTLGVMGFLLFLSVFVTGIANFGNFDNFDAQVRSAGFRAITGMGLMILGSMLARIGTKGLAGSGVILDPEKAREDLEPWNRSTGGMLQDTLSEVDVVKRLEGRLEDRPPEIRVRCQNCHALNDETARFCNQCGQAMA